MNFIVTFGVCGAQVMQDWLNERKLDRKALTALSTNLAAVEAWEEYVLEEAEAVVRSLVAAVAGEPEDGEAEEDGSERPPGGSVSASDAEAAAEGPYLPLSTRVRKVPMLLENVTRPCRYKVRISQPCWRT